MPIFFFLDFLTRINHFMIGNIRICKGNMLKIVVSPMLVMKDNIISNIVGATNIVRIGSKNLQDTILIGEGAGRYPTANSVVNDIMSLVLHKSYINNVTKRDLIVESNWSSTFYIRFRASDRIGLVGIIGHLCEKNNISINSLQQLPFDNPNNLVFIVLTETCKIKNIENLKVDIRKTKILLEDIFYMPLLE